MGRPAKPKGVGPVLAAWLTTRRGDDDWCDDLEPLAELATAVAASIDAGDVSGPLVKELRALLAELRREEVAGDAFELLAAELSAAVHVESD